VYDNRDPVGLRLVKLKEAIDQLEKSMTYFWRHVDRDKNRAASQDNDWGFYHRCDSELNKAQQSMKRFRKKHGIDEKEYSRVLNLHMLYNASRCYGGSF